MDIIHAIGYGVLLIFILIQMFNLHKLAARNEALSDACVKMSKERAALTSSEKSKLLDLDDCRKDNIDMMHRISELNKELRAAKEEIRRHERERYKG
jgi:hypothetical protein